MIFFMVLLLVGMPRRYGRGRAISAAWSRAGPAGKIGFVLKFPPMVIDTTRLHELHAARMSAWGLTSSDAYEFDVVHRVIDWARGVKPEPIGDDHWQEDMGMCLECDAAGLVAAWREDEGDAR